MTNLDQMREAFREVEKAVQNDGERLAMDARIIANSARALTEAAERCVTDRLVEPWPALPEIPPLNTKLTSI